MLHIGEDIADSAFGSAPSLDEHVDELFALRPTLAGFAREHARIMTLHMLAEAIRLPSILHERGMTPFVCELDAGQKSDDELASLIQDLNPRLVNLIGLFTSPANLDDSIVYGDHCPILLVTLYRTIDHRLLLLPGAVAAFNEGAWGLLSGHEPGMVEVQAGTNSDRFWYVYDSTFGGQPVYIPHQRPSA